MPGEWRPEFPSETFSWYEGIEDLHVQDQSEFPQELGDEEERGETQLRLVSHPFYRALIQKQLNL